MRLVHLLDLPEVPWRNGGGVTRETAAYRDAAVNPDFLWRVSMATVNAAGPFSRFDGVDRSIAVLDGDGIVLRLGDGDHRLTPSADPFSFAGEEAVDATVIGGPTSDLNIMTRRSHFIHTMRRIKVEGTVEFVAAAEMTALVFLGHATVGATGMVRAMDALVGIEAGTRLKLAATDGPLPVIVVEIDRA